MTIDKATLDKWEKSDDAMRNEIGSLREDLICAIKLIKDIVIMWDEGVIAGRENGNTCQGIDEGREMGNRALKKWIEKANKLKEIASIYPAIEESTAKHNESPF